MNEPETPYQALPECVRQYHSEREFLWMSDSQKATLVRDETEPEVEQ